MKTSSCCFDWSICILLCVKSPYLKSWCHYYLHYMIALLGYLLVVKNMEPQTRTYYVNLWDMHVAMRTLGRYLISLKSKFGTKACATHPADFANRSRWSWVPINVLVCQVANPLRLQTNTSSNEVQKSGIIYCTTWTKIVPSVNPTQRFTINPPETKTRGRIWYCTLPSFHNSPHF